MPGGDDACPGSSDSSSLPRRSRAALDGAAVAGALGHDHDEAVRALLGELLEVLDELAARGGLVGQHERDVERQALGVDVDHDVLDRQAGLVLEPLRQVAPQPARGHGGQRRDDDLVDAVGADRVGGGVERVGVADLAGALDALVAHEREREVDAHLGGVAHRLVVDDVAVARAALRDDDVEARVALACGGRGWRRAARAPPIVSLARTRTLAITRRSCCRTRTHRPAPLVARLVAPPRRGGRCRAPRRGRRTRTGRRPRSGRCRS